MKRQNKFEIEHPDLLKAFQSGSEQAFDVVFKHFYPMLCLFGNRIVMNGSSHDIAHDALIKAWEMRNNFESTAKLKSYLFTVVRNASLKTLEKSKVQQRYRNALIGSEFNEPDLLGMMIQAEVISRIFSEVDILPPQCKKVILMTFEEGKKPSEIAQKLGVTVSTVNSQKMRGLSLLRQKLNEEDFFVLLLLMMPYLWK